MVDDKKESKGEEEIDEQEKKSSANWKKPAIIVVALIAIIALSFIIAKYFVVPGYREYQVKKEIESQEEVKMSANEIGFIHIMDNFTVNVIGSNGRRYVIAEFAIEVSDENAVAELEEKDPVLRDEFISYFRSQSVVDVLDIGFQQRSRQKLMTILDKNIYTGSIDSLYYLKLLLQ